MSANQTRTKFLAIQHNTLLQIQGAAGTFWLRAVVLSAVCMVSLFVLGASTVPTEKVRAKWYSLPVAGKGFDLFAWEASALWEKAQNVVSDPAREVRAPLGNRLVRRYLDGAADMSRLEQEINALHSSATGVSDGETDHLQRQLDGLRQEQQRMRPVAEQLIQNQVGSVLVDYGFGIGGRLVPPVQFTFTEPPRKLIVSPRDRIETIYGRMLEPEISLDEIKDAERIIAENADASAYITKIGGLGAFPTMVVDRATLNWVLNTVAHEWAHNYLAFFPLGWFYFASQDMTTINESVAEIVGDEIGSEVFTAYYSELVEPLAPGEPEEQQAPKPDEAPFDFRREMRATRLEVDGLLAEGNVDKAEEYMEVRRQFFVENGYPLRVLNQAYFAFHGSYGTSPASTSPIGPKLRRLRELSPDLRTFLHIVRKFNSADDLDKALSDLETEHLPVTFQGQAVNGLSQTLPLSQ